MFLFNVKKHRQQLITLPGYRVILWLCAERQIMKSRCFAKITHSSCQFRDSR
ncbi:hypothetical protein EXN66_Car005808 [Channa argus]|uniref:Uncharacterized protein n=1 Tax=Channa argus TaxID=215402 RepID=A0A6G1PJF1_CHAAH|nr:hypothetical protein EXN66_Car005808 [Channa argus]